MNWSQEYRRRESLPIDEVHKLVDHTENAIHQVSDDTKSRKNSFPLILLVEGTKKLVDKLHTGTEELVSFFTDNAFRIGMWILDHVMSTVLILQAERGFTRQLDTFVSVENRLILLLKVM